MTIRIVTSRQSIFAFSVPNTISTYNHFNKEVSSKVLQKTDNELLRRTRLQLGTENRIEMSEILFTGRRLQADTLFRTQPPPDYDVLGPEDRRVGVDGQVGDGRADLHDGKLGSFVILVTDVRIAQANLKNVKLNFFQIQ